MKPVRSILGICLVSIFCIAGCIQETGSRSYVNSEYGFSFNPPPGWVEIETDVPPIAVWFSPEKPSNVSLIVDAPFSLSEGRALSTFADQVEEELAEQGMNYSLVFRDWRSISDAQAYEIVYLVEQEGTLEYVKQVAVLKTRTVFLITFSAPYTVSESYLPVVDQSIESFL
jgi:hypothetical protein